MDAIREAARWLVASREPVVTADMVYRHPTVAKDLVALAELLAMAVVDRGIYSVNFPTQHPLYVSGNSEEILKGSDLILALDCHELYAEITSKDKFNVKPRRYLTEFLAPGAKVVQIALEGLLVGSWSNQAGRIQPVDLDILADTKLALPALIEECRMLLANDSPAAKLIAARQQRMAPVNDGRRSGVLHAATKQ